MLPHHYADLLLRHLATCPTCRETKVCTRLQKCWTGQRLLRLTLEERHGRIEDHDK